MAGDFGEAMAGLGRLSSLLGHAAAGPMGEVVAEEIANEARRSARAKGGRSFWVRDIFNSIHVEHAAGGMIVGSTHFAAAFKQFGGTISAPGRGPGSLRRTYLAIPVGEARRNRWDTDAAEDAGYTLSPATLGRRRFLFGKKDRTTRRGAGKGKGGRTSSRTEGKETRGTLLFVLKKSVTQQADPWFPLGQSLADAVERGMDIYLSTLGTII